MNRWSVLQVALAGVSRLSAVLAMVSLGALVLLFIAIIALRPFGVAIPSADEFGGILLAGTFVLGLGAAVGYDEHLEVRILVQALPPAPRRALALLAIVVSILTVGALLNGVGALWIGAYARGTTMIGGLGIPRAVPIGVVMAGVLLFEIALILKFLQMLVAAPPSAPNPERPDGA